MSKNNHFKWNSKFGYSYFNNFLMKIWPLFGLFWNCLWPNLAFLIFLDLVTLLNGILCAKLSVRRYNCALHQWVGEIDPRSWTLDENFLSDILLTFKRHLAFHILYIQILNEILGYFFVTSINVKKNLRSKRS